jgi:SET domain-containing protein
MERLAVCGKGRLTPAPPSAIRTCRVCLDQPTAMPRRPFRLGRSFTGLGLFATRAIKKRTRLAEYTGPILDLEAAERAERRGNRYLYEVSTHRTIDGTGRRNIARYFNHSCNPNAESLIWRGRVFIRTLRNIKPGEEITYDYGTDYLKYVIGRSNCKCSRCRRRRAKRARELRALKMRRAARLKRQRRAKRKSKRSR